MTRRGRIATDNPQQGKKVLERNMEIFTALPCRISVYEEGGATRLATIKPTAILALYGTPELKDVPKRSRRRRGQSWPRPRAKR